MGASIDNAGMNNCNEIGVVSSVSQHVEGGSVLGIKKHKKSKKSKKKKKKRNKRRSQDHERDGVSSSSDSELDVVNSGGVLSKKSLKSITALPRGPKPKFHTPTGAAGISAAAARPNFSSSDDEKESDIGKKINSSQEKPSPLPETSDSDLVSSDLDTDFSVDDLPPERTTTKSKRITKPSAKVAEAIENINRLTPAAKESSELKKTVKLKIKLPPKPGHNTPVTANALNSQSKPQLTSTKVKMPMKSKKAVTPSAAAAARRQARLAGIIPSAPLKVSFKKKKYRRPSLLDTEDASKMSEKMRRSLALNRGGDSDSESDSSYHDLEIDERTEQPRNTEENNVTINHALIDTKVYCYCQSPHDDVSEMIGNIGLSLRLILGKILSKSDVPTNNILSNPYLL